MLRFTRFKKNLKSFCIHKRLKSNDNCRVCLSGCTVSSNKFCNLSTLGIQFPRIIDSKSLLNNFTQRSIYTSNVRNSLVAFKLSDIGEGIKEVEVKEWYVSVGDEVSQFDDICEVQSDKASVTITSRYDGIIKKLYYNIGDVAQVGETLVDIKVEAEEEECKDTTTEEIVKSELKEPDREPISPPVLEVEGSSKALATPAVRKIAKEHNINLTDVKGSGDNGRILKEDILRHVAFAGVSAQKAPSPTVLTADKVEPIKGIRKAMLTSMNASLSIPHFGYDDEYNMNELVTIRKTLKKEIKYKYGLKLSYMPFIIKATSLALSEHPILNSQIDAGHENLIYKADHNISFATDTPHGLLLPCIKSVQDLSIIEIASELNRLHEAGLNNKISPADIAGGTFSLSNIGNIGGTYARPVIFPPQVAIGALGRIQVLPRFNDDGDVIRAHMMCVSWSGDHRVIEGATMARFSNMLKDYLENPTRMLLHLK